jgi:predicted dinucleotide-binding enzyme
VALFLCGDDAEAKAVVAGLIEDAGFTPIDAGGTADAAIMEAPRRAGAVYGEEFHADDGRAFLAAARGQPAP